MRTSRFCPLVVPDSIDASIPPRAGVRFGAVMSTRASPWMLPLVQMPGSKMSTSGPHLPVVLPRTHFASDPSGHVPLPAFDSSLSAWILCAKVGSRAAAAAAAASEMARQALQTVPRRSTHVVSCSAEVRQVPREEVHPRHGFVTEKSPIWQTLGQAPGCVTGGAVTVGAR